MRLSRFFLVGGPTSNITTFSITSALVIPIFIATLWLIVASLVFDSDLFYELSDYERQVKSDDIVIITIDEYTQLMNKDFKDDPEFVFGLVDSIFARSEPKLIALDYSFSQFPESQLDYKKHYKRNLIWGSKTVSVGGSEKVLPHHPLLFKDELKRQFSSGHLNFRSSALSSEYITQIQLAKVLNQKLSIGETNINTSRFYPSLSLLAYAIAEKGVSGYALEAKLNHNNSQKDSLQRCDDMVSFFEIDCTYPFIKPHRFKAYDVNDFDTISAAFLQSNSINFSKFDEKYIFIASTWDKNNDYFLPLNVPILDKVLGVFGLQDMFNLSPSIAKKIPGVYFHAFSLQSMLDGENMVYQACSISNAFHGAIFILLTIIASLSICRFVLILTNWSIDFMYHFVFGITAVALFFIMFFYVNLLLNNLNVWFNASLLYLLSLMITSISLNFYLSMKRKV